VLEDERATTCGHADMSFRRTIDTHTKLICWECLLEDLQELRVDQAALVVRVTE
jgi:hypothetical protein